MGKKTVGRLLFVVIAAAAGFLGWQEWTRRQASTLPPGIIAGNGRIESIQVDVAAKYAGRVRRIEAREGDLVEPGQVIVRMDAAELEAELGIPIYDTISTVVWKSLKLAGVDPKRVTGWGRLFQEVA